jgi:hypothetical protein
MRVGGFKKEDYWAYMYQLREDIGDDEQVALYSDGLSCHHSKATYEIMLSLNIIPVKSIGYTPELQPVEAYWAVVKRMYKKQLFNFLSKNPASDLDLFQMVKNIVDSDVDFDYKNQV